MTGQADNVGFLATESGVKQFQPWLGESFVLQCRRFFSELRSTTHTNRLDLFKAGTCSLGPINTVPQRVIRLSEP